MSNAADTAANFGYSMAFFNSDPELKSLLNKAVTGNWTPSKFVAMLQGTKWFKKNGESARQIYALKTSDPATYKQRLNSSISSVSSIAMQIGAGLSAAQMSSFAANALAFGWTNEQIKAALVQSVHSNKAGQFTGGAASVQQQINEMAGSYGITPSSAQMGGWIRNVVSGAWTTDQIKQTMIAQTASKFPGLKDRLVAGETLDDIAAPYKDSYSRILEVNPKTISLSDPSIQKALSTKDSKGKPSTATVWQYENDLRSDPRWLKTKNAQDSLVGTTHKILTDMGLTV